MKIFRPKVISNVNLHRVTVPPAATDLIRHRRWQWIGHVLRKESTDDGKIALTWHASTGGRKREKPTVTWRRMVEKEQNQFHWRSCGEAASVARKRAEWSNSISALCDLTLGAKRNNDDEWLIKESTRLILK